MVDRNYGALRSAEKFEAFVDRILSAGKAFGFDIESGYKGPDREGTSLQTHHPNWILVGFSFTNSLEWARYVPIAHDDGDNVDDVVRTARALWRLLASGLGVAHNAKFELAGLSRWFLETLASDPEVGPEVIKAEGYYPILSDSLVEAFLTAEYNPLNPGQDLKSLTNHIFGHQMTKYADLWPDAKPAQIKKSRFNALDLTPRVIAYACEDSVWCLALHLKHYPDLADQLIYKTEIALVPILARMEKEGILLDWSEIHRKAEEVKGLQSKMNEQIQRTLSDRLGRVVNINLGSTKQLSEILFGELGIPVKERSEKTNEPSTSEKALRAVAKVDPVIKQILQYREIMKLHGSYLHKYDTQLNYAGTGRAHANHKQTGAGTGRMSVDGVSYQQWPKPYHYELDDGTVFDLNFRNLLLAPPGTRIIGFDYSQVELRILAGNASEDAMLDAFAKGIDIHKATASSMKKMPLDAVTKKDRSEGKTLNFAVVYGSGAGNIADMLTSPEAPVTKEDAEDLLTDYFSAFSKLKAWMDNKVVEGRQQGFVYTMFGRKFRIWEYESPNAWIRSKGDRMCVNAPIQGGAADYAKIAMVRADKAIRKAEEDGTILPGDIRMVMMVHDALEFYVNDRVKTQTVLDVLGPAVSYAVPGLPEIRADWHEGQRWGEVIEIKMDAEKKIAGYAIEDVAEEFPTIDEAYAYLDLMRRDDSAPKEVAAATPEPPQAPLRRAVVTVQQMPDENQWYLLDGFRKKHTGGAGMMLITPEGAVTFEGVKVTKEDQPALSALLGGATVTFEKDVTEEEMDAWASTLN